MALEQVYRHNTELSSRRILEERLAGPSRCDPQEQQCILLLHPIADFIWTQLDGRRDLAAVLEEVVDHFEVEPEKAETDLVELVEVLETGQLIVEVR